MQTLNDEWLMEQLLAHVEKVGGPLGYCLTHHDGGCASRASSWYVEKDGLRYEIQFERLYLYIDQDIDQAIRQWLNDPTR
jgi:hypothetical protein